METNLSKEKSSSSPIVANIRKRRCRTRTRTKRLQNKLIRDFLETDFDEEHSSEKVENKITNMADKLTLDRNAMKDRSTSHLRIYVGGISDSATVDELYEHFKSYGQIDGIVINRGFGFVQFNDESSAQKAICKADGSIFQLKKINVKTAQTNTDKMRRDMDVVKQSELPPAVALTDNMPITIEDGDEPYDSYGNFIGDNSYKDEGDYDSYEGGYHERGGRGGRGRGAVRARGRGGRGRGAPGFRDRTPPVDRRGGDWQERGGGGGGGGAYERYPPPPEYPRALPVPERNDCEIIVVSKGLTEYAEYIEGRLKRLGIVVDLLFPMEDVPIGKVLGNIASRGCLYAILVTALNQENRSLTLTILHGLPQEHRNMPLEDALQLLSRNFQEIQRGGPTGREAVYALLGQLADGRTLTVKQYDKVLDYVQERRTQQIKLELGEASTPAAGKTEAELQQRILSILKDKAVVTKEVPQPVPPPTQPPPPQKTKLLDDPTVRKALDSILQKFA